MGYYVVPGKSITTRRGIVDADDPRPEITPACICENVKYAKERLEHLTKAGYLQKLDKPPVKAAAPAPPKPPSAPRSGQRGRTAAADPPAADAD